jgi:hypothetical protein
VALELTTRSRPVRPFERDKRPSKLNGFLLAW